MPTGNSSVLLSVEGVSKHFGGVYALSGINLDVRSGEVHGVVGENGAGKTTLINILGGIIARDAGHISLDGRGVEFANPSESQRAGIAIIHQELATIPALTVMENVHMGRMMTRRGFVDWRRLAASTRAVLDEVGLEASPAAIVSSLSIAQRQLVEIAKALVADARLIIMDEPNASLTDHESERLFEVVAHLRARGVGIIFVSHKIEEVLRISDRITVLRDGTCVGTVSSSDTSVSTIVGMMVGRELAQAHRRPRREVGETLLEVRNLRRSSAPPLRDVSFSVHRGEILGFAGLVGAGRSETARAIFGADRFDSGEILFKGEPIRFDSPSKAVSRGIAMVPEERKRLALFMDMPIRFNIGVASLPRRSPRGIVNHGDQAELARSFTQKLSIKL